MFDCSLSIRADMTYVIPSNTTASRHRTMNVSYTRAIKPWKVMQNIFMITVFWDVKQCHLVKLVTFGWLNPWRWWEYVLKFWKIFFIREHSITSYKIAIFTVTAMTTSNLKISLPIILLTNEASSHNTHIAIPLFSNKNLAVFSLWLEELWKSNSC